MNLRTLCWPLLSGSGGMIISQTRVNFQTFCWTLSNLKVPYFLSFPSLSLFPSSFAVSLDCQSIIWRRYILLPPSASSASSSCSSSFISLLAFLAPFLLTHSGKFHNDVTQEIFLTSPCVTQSTYHCHLTQGKSSDAYKDRGNIASPPDKPC